MRYFSIIKDRLSTLWSMWFVIMFISIWSVLNQDGSINRDGLLYLKQAYLISEGNWKEGLELFDWPLFSMLIALFHKITNIHLQFAAHVIDLALFGIASYYYLKTLQLISQQKYIIFYAGLILLSFIPIMDDYVGMILRDPGLWAGCMAGTYFYFKYITHNCTIKYNLLWQFSFMMAGAFRPEGLVFIIAIPLFNIFFVKNKFKKKFFKFILNQILFLLLVCFYFFISKNITVDSESSIEPAGRLVEFGPRIFSFFKQISSPLPIFTEHEFLNILLQNNPVMITVAFLGSLFLIKVFKGLGMLNFILICTFLRKGSKLTKQQLLPLYFFITISLSLVFIEFFNHFVLTDRYFILSFFWILVVLSPVLHSLFELDFYKENKLLNYLVVILIIIFLINVLIDKKRYDVEIKAGEFLKQLQIVEDVTLINSDRIAYYAGFSMQQILNLPSATLDYQDWVVLYTKDKLNIIKPIGYDTFKSFEHKGQAVFFYKKENAKE